MFYGNDNWNQGTGKDAFYFCNGVDDMLKWVQSLTTLKTAASSADTTITLTDSLAFPASGTVTVVKNDGTILNLAYTANNTGTGVLTLSGTVGANVNAGNSVTMAIQDMTGMKIGNVIKVSAPQSGVRLFVANNLGNESSVFFSKSTNQEDFGVTADQTTGGVQVITDGDGPVLDLIDFGTFLAVIKKNAFSQFYFQLNNTLSALIGIVTPLVFGESIEPVGQFASIVAESKYYYATKTQGIYALSPSATGLVSSSDNKPFSDKILSTLTDPNFSFANARTEFFQRKLLMVASSIANLNNLVLVYDFLYGAWLVWDNLNAADVKENGGTLYFISKDDGGLYFLDSASYQDFRNANAVEYQTYCFSKSFDFGESALPKQTSLAMIRGVISQNTKLLVDVLFNEGGSLALSTYTIDGNGLYVTQVPVFGIGRASIGQNPLGGFQKGTIGKFRVYLDLLFRAGANVIQFKVYSSKQGDNWGVEEIAVNPSLVENAPPELVIGVL